jgi:hypothetical protein
MDSFWTDVTILIKKHRHIMLFPVLMLALLLVLVIVLDRSAFNVPIVYAGF